MEGILKKYHLADYNVLTNINFWLITMFAGATKLCKEFWKPERFKRDSIISYSMEAVVWKYALGIHFLYEVFIQYSKMRHEEHQLGEANFRKLREAFVSPEAENRQSVLKWS